MFIEILTADQTFPYKPTPDSEIELRIITDEKEKEIRKKRTKREWDKGGRADVVDVVGFSGDILDHAIVSWTGVRAKGADTDLPCTREYKLLLPEALKSEITRLTLGKEGGMLRGDDEAETEKKD